MTIEDIYCAFDGVTVTTEITVYIRDNKSSFMNNTVAFKGVFGDMPSIIKTFNVNRFSHDYLHNTLTIVV